MTLEERQRVIRDVEARARCKAVEAMIKAQRSKCGLDVIFDMGLTAYEKAIWNPIANAVINDFVIVDTKGGALAPSVTVLKAETRDGLADLGKEKVLWRPMPARL